MTEHDLRQIKEMVREENESLFEKIQKWTSESMVSKNDYLKDQLEYMNQIIQPLKTRINALWLSLSMIGGLATVVFFLKG